MSNYPGNGMQGQPYRPGQQGNYPGYPGSNGPYPNQPPPQQPQGYNPSTPYQSYGPPVDALPPYSSQPNQGPPIPPRTHYPTPIQQGYPQNSPYVAPNQGYFPPPTGSQVYAPPGGPPPPGPPPSSYNSGPYPSSGYASPSGPQGYSAGYNAPPQWASAPAGFFQQHPGLVSTCNGRKKALLIGINYKGTQAALKGCINDVNNIRSYLCDVRGWPRDPGSIVVLTDDNPNPTFRPTRQNMINAMQWLATCNQSGDSLFFHFSGHGGQQQDKGGDEADGYDETILPEDYKRAGVITDDELNAILVRNLPPGVRLTAVFDCCHSGSALDLPFMYYPDGRLVQHDTKSQLTDVAKTTVSHLTKGNLFGALTAAVQGINTVTQKPLSTQEMEQQRGNRYADVIMFSGCKDQQTSADAYLGGQSTGAMSFALIKALTQTPHCTYGQLLQSIRVILKEQFHQVPQLSSGRYMDMNQPFMI